MKNYRVSIKTEHYDIPNIVVKAVGFVDCSKKIKSLIKYLEGDNANWKIEIKEK